MAGCQGWRGATAALAEGERERLSAQAQRRQTREMGEEGERPRALEECGRLSRLLESRAGRHGMAWQVYGRQY